MILSSFFTNNANTTGSIPADPYTKVGTIQQGQDTAPSAPGTRSTADKTTLSGLGQLHSALASFQGVVQALSGKGLNLSASTSAHEVLTAATSSRSVAGTYAVSVTQLAQSQVLRSRSVASPDAAIGLGEPSAISFDFGSTSGSTFTTSPAMSGVAVAIPSGSNTLQGIAEAINGAAIGVAAKLTANSSGSALELNSPAGAANSMRISVSGDPALHDLLAYNPLGVKQLSQTAAPQDAMLTINGVGVSSSSNAVAGTVPGTTLNLTAKGASRLVVAQGSAQLAENVTSLVTEFNTLNARLSALGQGDLEADGSATRIQQQLAGIVHQDAGGVNGGSVPALATVGITALENGDLAIDATKLRHAVSANPVGVAMLFTNGGKGIADHLASQIQSMVGPAGSLSMKATTMGQDMTTHHALGASPNLALTAQANALVNAYSRQVLQGYSTGTIRASTDQ